MYLAGCQRGAGGPLWRPASWNRQRPAHLASRTMVAARAPSSVSFTLTETSSLVTSERLSFSNSSQYGVYVLGEALVLPIARTISIQEKTSQCAPLRA